MKKYLLAAALGLMVLPCVALAALKVGDNAPDFKTQATLGGKHFDFVLADALKKGPVVLYFYPAAFTKGCTIEAHEFASAMDQYHALGATVVGVSHDTIETLDKFSVSECGSKFPVAADADKSIMLSYDAKIIGLNYANRTSYVISPEGKVIYSYTDLSPDKHVENTLAAVRKWQTEHPAK